MTKLEQIEKSVSELSPEEFKAFSDWFAELQARQWDEQIARDLEAGRLDDLISSARQEIAEGKVRLFHCATTVPSSVSIHTDEPVSASLPFTT